MMRQEWSVLIATGTATLEPFGESRM